MYKITFYTPDGKISPIKRFLNAANVPLRRKILRQLKYVQEFGLTPSVPNLRKIRSTPLWELRILGKDNLRIFCSNLPNKEIKVLHIFVKKKRKTPQKEITIALNRYEEIKPITT